MAIPACYRILVKALQYILSIQENIDTLFTDANPEIGVLFLTGSTMFTCKEEDKCTEVKVFYQGVLKNIFDVRCFVKTVGEEVDVIKELQLNANGPCLIASQVCCNLTKSYSFQYCSKVGWKFGTIEEQTTSENITHPPNFTVSVHVNLSASLAKNLHDSLLSFLKKCQLMMPYLTIISRINGQMYKRQGIQGLKQKSNWCNNVSIYLRSCSQYNISDASRGKCKQIYVKQDDSSQCPSFSVIYGSSLEAELGRENHLHIFAFSETGIPLLLENAMWHEGVITSSIQNSLLDFQAGPCAPALSDVCYHLSGTGPSTCYFLILLIRDESNLKLLLVKHSSLLASTVMKALEATISEAVAYEQEKRWSEIMATSVGSLIRFSTDQKFRKECLHLMEATDSVDAEIKLKHKLIHQLKL